MLNLLKNKSSLFVGYVNNLGHYIWNDLAGIESVIADPKFSEHLNSVISGPHSYFPVGAIFPEILNSDVKIINTFDFDKRIIRFSYESDPLPLRLPGNYISYGLRKRILAWALEDQVDFIRELRRLNDDDCLIVWFNLRAHNKVWIDQISCIPIVCESIRKALPSNVKLRVILDGTPDTSAIAVNLVKSLAGVVDETVDATNVSLSRSILLSTLIDFHISVVGSGLVIPSWLMGRRGVAHANTIHLQQKEWWNNISQGIKDTTFLDKQSVSDSNKPSFPNLGYVNYSINIANMIKVINPIFEQTDFLMRRSAVAQMINLVVDGCYSSAAHRVMY